MKLKTPLLSLAFAGTLILSACSNPDASSPSASTSPDGAQSMPGMDHGSMKDHGSMNMSLGPKDENFDLRFLDGMTPHHDGAVVMAQEALQKSQRPEIKQLAQAIIEAQKKEIAQMQQWRKAWYPNVGDTPMMYSAEMGHMMPMSAEMKSSMMMNVDLGAADNQFDLRFINAMVPHHEGALVMAQEALQKSDRPEIKQLAQEIISSQQQEISQMQQWKKAWYGQ
ncbi:MAG: DUF305 domain-containing protein [Drouetiella hepatica Uher 2000/2452]|uniref:DUF305 domain-containing protein n=1 Tax=Drouetiella hepatica Uher 2000/2452 TaxID=904376 RepID=A0A951QC03_9CYAN|nr:DUF305 domain-containing protein [Drouetiella hepatica Uher 2000/2452]